MANWKNLLRVSLFRDHITNMGLPVDIVNLWCGYSNKIFHENVINGNLEEWIGVFNLIICHEIFGRKSLNYCGVFSKSQGWRPIPKTKHPLGVLPRGCWSFILTLGRGHWKERYWEWRCFAITFQIWGIWLAWQSGVWVILINKILEIIYLDGSGLVIGLLF